MYGWESALTIERAAGYTLLEDVGAAFATGGEDGMDFGEVLRWLFSEAGAGWVLFLGSAVAWVVKCVLDRRPKRVACREIERASLVSVQRAVGDRVSVHFDGRPVESLALTRVEITNESLETLPEVSLHLCLPEDTIVLDHWVQSTPENLDVKAWVTSEGQIALSLPYLNSTRKHGDTLTLTVICSGDLAGTEALGRGPEWSVRWLSLDVDEGRIRMWRTCDRVATVVAMLAFPGLMIIDGTLPVTGTAGRILGVVFVGAGGVGIAVSAFAGYHRTKLRRRRSGSR